MSEPETPQDRRRNDTTTAALTGSSPDINAIFQGLVERFLALKGYFGAILAWWLSNIWILCAFGVTALLASIPFVDKLNEGQTAERDFQLKMFELQTDIELKKMDRTMLGEGAMTTLRSIADKLDQQATQTAQISQDVQRLSTEVGSLKSAQASTDRRVGSIASSQAQLRDRLNKAP